MINRLSDFIYRFSIVSLIFIKNWYVFFLATFLFFSYLVFINRRSILVSKYYLFMVGALLILLINLYDLYPIKEIFRNTIFIFTFIVFFTASEIQFKLNAEGVKFIILTIVLYFLIIISLNYDTLLLERRYFTFEQDSLGSNSLALYPLSGMLLILKFKKEIERKVIVYFSIIAIIGAFFIDSMWFYLACAIYIYILIEDTLLKDRYRIRLHFLLIIAFIFFGYDFFKLFLEDVASNSIISRWDYTSQGISHFLNYSFGNNYLNTYGLDQSVFDTRTHDDNSNYHNTYVYLLNRFGYQVVFFFIALVYMLFKQYQDNYNLFIFLFFVMFVVFNIESVFNEKIVFITIAIIASLKTGKKSKNAN